MTLIKKRSHAFVYQLSLKPSIKELTDEEAARVIRHLKDCRRAMAADPNDPPAISENPGASGFITKQQISKIFAKMYELQSLDPEPSASSIKQRISGIINKLFGVSPNLRGDIFKNLTFRQGELLIEEIKRYIRSAKKKPTP